jgi:hypothetical protein
MHLSRGPFLSAALAAVGTACFMQSSAHATSFTVNGFTGAFAPAEWTVINSSGGSSTINSTQADLSVTTASGSDTSIIFDTAKLAAPYPGFTTGTVTFNWTWSAPTLTPFFASELTYGNLGSTTIANVYTGPQPPSPLDVANIANYTTSDNNVSFNVSSGDIFLFNLRSTNPAFETSSAVISGFSFSGTQADPIPAPVPVLGAAAAFGFGRKLRRRLSVGGMNTSAYRHTL